MSDAALCSNWLADLAGKVRAIEADVETCTRRASVRRNGFPSTLETLAMRSELCNVADVLESISKEWADAGI